jgi:hypothetical protein
MAEKAAGQDFVDKEKQVLIAVAEKIGSTLGQVAALGNVAKKASKATARPTGRRRPARTTHRKSASKTLGRTGRAVRGKNRRSARRRT